MCADAPDTSGVNKAAVESSKLGKEQFDWFTREYARTAPERAAVVARDTAVADAQVKGMTFATDATRPSSSRWRTRSLPGPRPTTRPSAARRQRPRPPPMSPHRSTGHRRARPGR